MRTNNFPRSVLPRAFRAAAISCLFLGLGFVGGCGQTKPQAPVFPPRTAKLPDITHGGTVSGTVTFLGTPPRARVLSNADAWCNRKSVPIPDESILVDAQTQGLANVFVHVSKGLENYVFDYQKTPVKVEQTECIFKPHVVGVRRYQPVEFINDDATTHNVNTTTSQKKQGGSVTMAPGGTRVTRQFTENELMLAGSCDIHSNMLMYFHIVDDPYFAVTDAAGRWAFAEKLPPGTYEIEFLHERCGRTTQSLVVNADGTHTLTQQMELPKK